jgi:LysM repeat protein
MRVRLLLIVVLGFLANVANAQSGDLMVNGVSPALYLMHTVAPKENWYSVGRLYNVSPKEIAPFNNLTIDNPLAISQEVKIPLLAANFSQNGTRGNDEVSVPIYHIIQDKEWMYRISTNYNKVPIENLEKWNGISKDQAKTGMKIIIGYLKVKSDLSAFASRGVSTVKVAVAPEKTNPPPTTATAAPATTSTAPASTTAPVTTNPPVAIMPEKKSDPMVGKQDKKEEKQISPAEEKQVIASNPVVQPTANNTVSASGGAGYFKSIFDATGKSVSGSASVFKSTSGWQDGKYYALMNNVAVGTIIKVSNPINNKIVYAKVLGQLPDMKESVGLTARLSDAAALELGTNSTRFSVEVKY